MIYILSEEDSIAYLEGGWDQYNVEERLLDDLIRHEIQEPVAVVLCDQSAIAFYVSAPGVIL